MQFLITPMLLGWVPFCLLIFAIVPRRWAVVVAIIGAWIILPPSAIRIPGLTSYTKATSFAFGILLGTLLFTPERILRFRPHWLDLPMVCFCVAPFISSMANGLGAYDGGALVISQLSMWGLPYLVGRLHFAGERSLRDLVIGLAVGGLVLIPFCLYEMRMSPTLLNQVYGLGGFQRMRLGGWRPRILFRNGLEFGMWMSVTVLAAYWLWRSGVLKQVAGWSMGRVLLPTLTIVTVLCRSTGALALLVFGTAALWTAARWRKRWPMLLLTTLPFIYVAVRVPNVWDYSGLISLIQSTLDEDRAESLRFRFWNEDMLVVKAVQKPIFGWGGWGRARVFNEDGVDITKTDGLWIIILGNGGAFWLGCFLLSWTLPCYVFIRRYKPEEWGKPIAAGQAAVVGIIGMYMVDCLLNAFPNGVYVAALGGLVATLQFGRDETLANGAAIVSGRFEVADGAPAAPRPARVGPAEERLADRYVELARSSQRAGATADAETAWRHALKLFVERSAAAPANRDLARRRLDCANDLAWFLATRTDPGIDDRREAVELALGGVDADPGEAVYWNTLAVARCRTGDHQGALEAVGRSMDLADAANGYDFVVLALAHARIGRADEAGRWLAAAGQWRDRNQTADQALDGLLREVDAALKT